VVGVRRRRKNMCGEIEKHRVTFSREREIDEIICH